MAEEIIHQSRFRLGFELETQRFHQHRYGDEIQSDIPDLERWELMKKRKRESIYFDQTRRYPWAAAIADRMPSYDTVFDVLRRYAQETQTDIRDRVAQEIEREVNNTPCPMKQLTTDSSFFLSLLSPSMRDRFQCERDGTVSGPEIQTKGGMTIDQTRNAARYLFSHPMAVDSGCSFHIHMSIIDVQHKPSDSLQMHMIDYLMRNVSRIPTNVLKRWITRNSQDNCRYFSPKEPCTSRYAFVAFRTQEGDRKPITWEFRCWGGIDTFEDADKCIQLTTEAYTHAHKQYVLLGKPYGRSRDALAQDLFYKTQFELDRRNGIPLPNLSSAVGE